MVDRSQADTKSSEALPRIQWPELKENSSNLKHCGDAVSLATVDAHFRQCDDDKKTNNKQTNKLYWRPGSAMIGCVMGTNGQASLRWAQRQ